MGVMIGVAHVGGVVCAITRTAQVGPAIDTVGAVIGVEKGS